MLTPSVFERVRVDDFTITPFTVHKDYYIDKVEAENTGSGYTVRKAIYNTKPLYLEYNHAHLLQAPTSSDGTYAYLNWRSLNHLYYRNPYAPSQTLEGYNQNRIHKFLYATASIISSPYFDIGEGMKPGSIHLTSSNLNLYDDRNGNLVDTSLASFTFVDQSYLDAYFGFQELLTKTEAGTITDLVTTSTYITNTNGEDTFYQIHNLKVLPGIEVDGLKTGLKVAFTGINDYILVRNNPAIDYEFDENFTLSFWAQIPSSQSFMAESTNTLISKKSLVDVQEIGTIENTVDESNVKLKRIISNTEIKKRPTDIFPYHFETYNTTAPQDLRGKVGFKRSDGSYTLYLTSSQPINDGNFHHICVVKDNSNVKFYIDGQIQCTGLDATRQTTNGYHVVIGAEDLQGSNQFSGSLDEIRFYSLATSASIVSSSLAEKTLGGLYQTANVGNVFYKRGEVIITSPNNKYNTYFDTEQWEVRYKNIYTIYEYETLVRIKAGQYNRTMNPSSLKSSKSTAYSEAFTSGSLLPYATTVGLYNDKLQLVAVGKLGRPLKMREDVDINLIVRWDY